MYSIKGSKEYDNAWKWSIFILYIGVILYISHKSTNSYVKEPMLYYQEMLRFVEHFVLAVFCFRAFATVWQKNLVLKVFFACFLFVVLEEAYTILVGSMLTLSILVDLLISTFSIALGIALARMQGLTLTSRRNTR